MTERKYIAIDLKSFYASVECVERGLDPLRTNLVVADVSRTEKTICLAVSPALKSWGIPGRPRLFEVIQKVKKINAQRLREAPGRKFSGESSNTDELRTSPELALSYLVVPPRMSHYIDYSTRVYDIYLNYVAPEDIHVYSIDEVFMDVTAYLDTYRQTVEELAMTIVQEVQKQTGITATVGIGTNLYLAKIAMDIVAKHIAPDQEGVRMASLNEMDYRYLLWDHRPLTDFWRVGKGYARKLEEHGLYTMGDVARCSLGDADAFCNEDLLYRLFGVNAELLIDHAWGWEPCTIAQIKAYRPENNSMGSGQVLHCPYEWEKARLVVLEMADMLALELVDRGMVTDQLVLTVGYDIANLTDPKRRAQYQGTVVTDQYGRKKPKHAHGTENLLRQTSSSRLITEAAMKLFDRITDQKLLVRRVSIAANHVVPEGAVKKQEEFQQLDLFTDYEALERQQKEEEERLEKEKRLQKAMLSVKKKYGKNAILKGMNLQEGATARDRNEQIGGHRK